MKGGKTVRQECVIKAGKNVYAECKFRKADDKNICENVCVCFQWFVFVSSKYLQVDSNIICFKYKVQRVKCLCYVSSYM